MSCICSVSLASLARMVDTAVLFLLWSKSSPSPTFHGLSPEGHSSVDKDPEHKNQKVTASAIRVASHLIASFVVVPWKREKEQRSEAIQCEVQASVRILFVKNYCMYNRSCTAYSTVLWEKWRAGVISE